jgi:hypothetical protein
MTLYDYFEQLFNFLHTRQHQIPVMAVYVCCFLLVLFLRGGVCLYFRGLLFRLKMEAKELKSKDAIKKIKLGLLRSLAADYMQVAARNASRIPTQALTDKHIAGLGALGWRYASIMSFVELMENGLIWIGLVIALLFTDYAMVYGMIAVVGFLLTRAAAAFFDFRLAQSNLANELHLYLERELGAFYPINISGTILPKLDLTEAAAGMYSVLSKPMDEWARSLAEAGQIQSQINKAALKLQTAAEALSIPLKEHGQVLASLTAEQGNLLKHTQLVEQNQHALQNAYDAYEKSLQGLVQTMGDGLGAYLQLHGQTAAKAVNDTLAGNIDKIVGLLQSNSRHGGGA